MLRDQDVGGISRGDQSCEMLSKLAQLDQTNRGVVVEIPLRLKPKKNKLGVMPAQKREIARHPPEWSPSPMMKVPALRNGSKGCRYRTLRLRSKMPRRIAAGSPVASSKCVARLG